MSTSCAGLRLRWREKSMNRIRWLDYQIEEIEESWAHLWIELWVHLWIETFANGDMNTFDDLSRFPYNHYAYNHYEYNHYEYIQWVQFVGTIRECIWVEHNYGHYYNEYWMSTIFGVSTNAIMRVVLDSKTKAATV